MSEINIKALLKDLNKQCKKAKKNNDAWNSASFGYEEGCLMTFEQVQALIVYVHELRESLKRFVDCTDPLFADQNGFGLAHKQAKKILKHQ